MGLLSDKGMRIERNHYRYWSIRRKETEQQSDEKIKIILNVNCYQLKLIESKGEISHKQK